MKNEEKQLIELCRAYLNGGSVRLNESVDFSRLFSVCREHNLIAIAFCSIKRAENKNIVPTEIYNQFENSFFETIMRHEKQTIVINELDNLLSQNEIKHIFFKGAEIRGYYPVPEARAMGDIDVLIDINDRDSVKKIMLSNGFELKNSNGPVYDYIKGTVLIEMHTKIISGRVGNSKAETVFEKAIDNAVFDGFKGRLNENYHLAYQIAHIAHHFWFYGAGIKLILDLAVMQMTFKIDFDKVFAILEDAGLVDFARVIFSVCSKWFGVGKDYGVDTAVTEKFISYFGAFGNAKRNKAAVIQRKELEDGKSGSAFSTRLHLLFPTYEKMKNIPYIKFIEGRPWLTPFAWVYRIFYNLKYKKDFLRDATAGIGSKNTNIQAQRELEYFEEIGLL